MVNIEDIKLPPHNVEAEKWIIWSILINNESLYLLEDLNIEAEDFYQKEHKIIYHNIKKLWIKQKTIDVITLNEIITKQWEIDNIGGIEYLYELSGFVITSGVAEEYWKILKEKAILRKILKTSQDIIWEVYKEMDLWELLNTVEKRIFNITQINLSDSLRHIEAILNERMEQYQAIVDDPGKMEREKVSSWYSNMDKIFWWFNPWDLVVLAARPSMWKTSFALNLASNAAMKQNKIISIFSLEMWTEQIADRILSQTAQIPLSKINRWELEEEDFSQIWDSMANLADCNIFIDDKWGSTIREIKSKLRRLKAEKQWLDMIIIDYLQLMSSADSKFAWNRVQEISEISRGLKELARELEVPIIALSQLSRAVEQRPDKTPQLSDLRESWAIEQDADSVLMLYRDDYYDEESDKKWIAEIFVRKNRNWPIGKCEFHFTKEIMKFYEKSNIEEDF